MLMHFLDKNPFALQTFFFAVFRHYDNWGWEALPLKYRINPLINLDMVNTYYASPQIQHLNSCPETQSFTDNTDYVTNPLPLPLPKKAAVRKERQCVLGQCQTLKEMLHQCQDISVMSTLEETIEGAITILTKSLPKCGPFIREDRNTTHIGTIKKDEEAFW
ncbi:unnamed protein product [Mytilus coruscus]|uniref:Uncharacterized protein n=1 Tax=Mytilus coruscus TaxID=42192 RepID=A0A6J8B7J2_MYTCO|nr:unnamed protein product [Mytilus coruscus]